MKAQQRFIYVSSRRSQRIHKRKKLHLRLQVAHISKHANAVQYALMIRVISPALKSISN